MEKKPYKKPELQTMMLPYAARLLDASHSDSRSFDFSLDEKEKTIYP